MRKKRVVVVVLVLVLFALPVAVQADGNANALLGSLRQTADGYESHHAAGTWEGSIEDALGMPPPWSEITWSLESAAEWMMWGWR